MSSAGAAGTGRRDRTPETEGLGQRIDLLTVLEAGCVRSGASKAGSPEGSFLCDRWPFSPSHCALPGQEGNGSHPGAPPP